MKRAIFPGSFNPWHRGHTDILIKALAIFDHVDVAVMENFEKNNGVSTGFSKVINDVLKEELTEDQFARVVTIWSNFKLSDFLKVHGYDAVIRGLRNEKDFLYEKDLSYWYEDMGIKIPITYFVCDRKFCHISSSAIRLLEGK